MTARRRPKKPELRRLRPVATASDADPVLREAARIAAAFPPLTEDQRDTLRRTLEVVR